MELSISIVLPNYNGEKYLKTAIQSFLDQDYALKEMVIVDGKSTDSSHEIIAFYVSRFDNIIWVKENDTSVTDAFNIGIQHAKGDFIAFLAADVFYFDSTIFSIINNTYGKIKFDIIYFDYYHYEPNNFIIKLLKCPNVEFNRNNLLSYGTIAGFDNVFIKREIYKKYNFDPKYNLCSDWEFFLKISRENYLYMYIERVCTINVQDGDNLSKKYADLQMKQIDEVAKIYNIDGVRTYYDRSVQNEISLISDMKNLMKKVAKRILHK